MTSPLSVTHVLARKGGFGLIELLVSISIMTLVTGTIIARHSAFNGASLLRSQAWEIALAIREVQSLAVSAANVGGGFRNTYGVSFDITPTGNRQGFAIFRDSAAPFGSFTVQDAPLGKQGVVDRRFEIVSITTFDLNNSQTSVTSLAITFTRPNYDANFSVTNVSRVQITVGVVGSSNPNDRRIIEITRTGQITVLGN